MTLQKRRLYGAVRPTVLIVDADSLYRWFVSEALTTHDVHVVQFRSVGEAVDFLHRRYGADLLIVDAQTLRDEGASAIETLGRLSVSVPCLLLDGSGDELHTPSTRDLVVADKPVDSTALIALVARHLPRAAGVARDPAAHA